MSDQESHEKPVVNERLLLAFAFATPAIIAVILVLGWLLLK